MDTYIIQSAKGQIDKFEQLRDIIKLKKNTKEVADILTEMFNAISDKPKIEVLSNKYTVHFSSSAVSWQMEYDIAGKILAKEMKSDKLTYIFELVNYCFYFLLLPPSFRNTFFLLHGMAVGKDNTEWDSLITKLRSKRYVVYKGSQELLSSYFFQEDILSKEDRALIELLYSFYNIEDPLSAITDSNKIFIIQASNRKK